jgi:tripartite-type tricarboxylate transporter receptor subunit TctC
MITRRRFAQMAAAASMGSVVTGRVARAQAWPTRFVRIIVPFPAGAPPDVGGRLIAARLSELWGQQVLVENRPGAGGNIGTAAVARSDPDGYTVLMAAFTHAVNLFLYRSPGYDPIVDFAPITLLSVQPCIMIVPNSSPAHSVAEFIAHARANRGRINYASAGHGTAPHLAGELFKRITGIEMTHVPYRTGPQQDLIAGRVDVMFVVAGSGIALMRAGQVRALAVTGTQRLAAAPSVPTAAEAGVPGFDVPTWWGLFVPARTAPAVIAKIHADTAAVLGQSDVRTRFQDFGSTPIGSSPGELAQFLRAEIEKWRTVIQEAQITIDNRE